MKKPVNLGLLGIGGYAQEHLGLLQTLQHAGQCRLVAVGDPFAARWAEATRALELSGVTIVEDPAAVLANPEIAAVFIATPVHLHAPQTIAALGAGKHVYVEKPPCATLGQWQAMMQAQEAAGKICAVGFQMQTSPAMHFLKEQMTAGVIGDIQNIWAGVRWRREDGYYDRAAWSGKWSVDGQPVFDGPASNALAHVVHGSLFLAGATNPTWGELKRVRGSLRKARPVESYDTSYLEAETIAGVNVRLVFTHATSHSDEVVIRVKGSKGIAELSWSGRVVIHPDGGTAESFVFAHRPSLASILDFQHAIASGDKPTTALADTLAYLQLVNGALQSSQGAPAFDDSIVEALAEGTQQCHYRVLGFDDEIAAFQLDAAAIPPLLAGADMPWIEAGDLKLDLPV